MTHTQTQGADGAGTNPFGAPAYDPASEIATQVMNLPWTRYSLTDPRCGMFDHDALGDRHGDVQIIARNVIGATPASTIPPDVRSLLRTARSGLATYGAGAFEGTILQIDAILAYDPIFPAPAATPGVPVEVRKSVLSMTEQANEIDHENDTGPNDEGFWQWWETAGGKFSEEANARGVSAAVNYVRALIAAQPAGQAGDAGADLGAYLARQMAWSQRAFGDRSSAIGLTKHIEKECAEIRANPHDLVEWVDVVMLALDGYWRHGGTPADVMPTLLGKLAKNEAREWPVNENPDEPNEHDRSDEPAPNSTRTGAAETIPVPSELVSKARSLAWSVKGDAYLGNEAETELAQEVDRALLAAERDALAARPEAPSDAGISVDVLTMRLSDGRADYFTRIRCGGREQTLYKFSQRYQAQYTADDLAWLLGLRAERPDLMAYDEASHPNDPTPPSDPAPSGQAEG